MMLGLLWELMMLGLLWELMMLGLLWELMMLGLLWELMTPEPTVLEDVKLEYVMLKLVRT
jgi:hypothetical protein